MKPYDETIVDFNTHMRECALVFEHLQPPFTKTVDTAMEAKWDKRLALDEETIR